MPEREGNIMTREAGDFKLNQVENQKDEEITDSKDKNTLLNTENKKLSLFSALIFEIDFN